MSTKPNMAAIGVFVVVGIALTVVAVVFLTSGSLFSPKLKGVTFFNESVAGLNVGAPTKFQGVVIGKVTGVSFAHTETVDSYIRVEVEIDVQLAIRLGAADDFDQASTMADNIRDGMRASLATESMVTGIRYVEIEFVHNPPEPVFFNTDDTFFEIPAVPSPMAGLTESVHEVIARVGAVDLPAVTQDLMELLEIAKRRAEALDVERLNDEVILTLEASRRFMRDPQIDSTLHAVATTMEAVEDLAVSLSAQAGPMISRMDSATVALNETLHESQRLLSHMENLMAPEGSFRYESEFAMREMGDMARALRRLAEELERSPGSLVRGKSEN